MQTVEARQQVKAYELAEPRPQAPHRSREKMGVSMDGTMIYIHKEGWKELKVGCVFEIAARPTIDPETKEEVDVGSAVNNTYVAHLGGPEAFGRQIWADARQRSWLAVEDSLAIGDGAAWIWNLVSEHFYTSHQIVDWYHATQHLAEAARSIYGEATPQYRRWYRQWETKLYQGHVRQLLRALKRQATLKSDIAEAILAQRTYFQNNLKRMNYLEMRMEGYPIGSGMVESAAKQYKGRFVAQGCAGVVLGPSVSFPSALLFSASVLTKCGIWPTTHPQIETPPACSGTFPTQRKKTEGAPQTPPSSAGFLEMLSNPFRVAINCGPHPPLRAGRVLCWVRQQCHPFTTV